MTKKLLKDREVAALLGCSVCTIWRRAADGKIPAPVKLGGLTRWRASDIEALIDGLTAEERAA
ncbi:MAG: helix-turn-helix domain-containing protein [Rhodobacteraceae bacterium]|nr:helix-turn-helix domain-containing protein [Paracoccaceae bacterium]